MQRLRIGLIGDHDEKVIAHRAIPLALEQSAREAACEVLPEWLHTAALAREPGAAQACDGLWCVPASPYANTDAALAAIRLARESGTPFLGTCAGFQHAILEYARNGLGLAEAAHAETDPDAAMTVIGRLACDLIEVRETVYLVPGSRAATLYGIGKVQETFHCRYGLDPRFRSRFDGGKLRITGKDRGGDARVVELEGHPFFLATLFQPERSALAGRAHPLITGFMRAALEARARTPKAGS